MSNIKLFENKQVRSVWDSEKEDWFFSVVDVCNILAESKSKDAGAYWRKLKQRLTEGESEVVTNCHELKLPAADGKTYKTDVLIPKYFTLSTVDSFTESGVVQVVACANWKRTLG